MTRFSLGVSKKAKDDLKRILNSNPPYWRPLVDAAARLLLDEIRVDPHLKGLPAPMPTYPHMRRLDSMSLRMFFWVRQPPLQDRYVEVAGFSWV